MAMTPRAGLQTLPVAVCSVLALISIARAQTPYVPGAQTTSPGGADRLSYGVDAGLGETDNVNLSPNNKVYQTMSVVDVDFDVKHKSRRLDVDAKGNFTDYDYLQGAFGNQLLGRFDGNAHLALIPQRLTWVLQDDFGQAALDPFAPVTPGNIEYINFVTTGPDLALRMGGTGFVDMSARVARAQYQISPFSSSRALGSLGVGLQLSARSSVSLNGVAERVLFDNTTVNGDFNRSSAYVRYDIQGARTGVSADLGVTKDNQSGSQGSGPFIIGRNNSASTGPITFSQSASTTTGPLARISVTRNLSQSATVNLLAGRELTDASSSFSGIEGGAIGIVGTASAVLTSSTYTSNFASAGWTYRRNRTTIGLSGRWDRDVYASQPQLDLTRAGAELNVNRRLSRAFALQVIGRYSKNDYINATPLILNGGSPKYDDLLVAGALTWRHSRAVEVRFRVEHSSRSTVPSGLGFQENRILVTVGYRPETEGSNNESEPEALRSIDNPGA
jgi:hypothetical protein